MYVNLKKKFGQNFLIDKNILNKIYIEIKNNNQNILEIGPGSGSLTDFILKSNPNKLTLIEIDEDLILILKDKYKQKNIEIIHSDFLKDEKVLNHKFDLIISNLPYYISSQILIKICLSANKPKRMILMFQKEFADRLLSKKLNSLNSVINCFFEIKKLISVSRNSFYPIPKVNSTVLEFIILNDYLLTDDFIIKFIKFKRDIFNKKRKTIKAVIKDYRNLGIPTQVLNQRAESLSLRELIEIFKKTNI